MIKRVLLATGFVAAAVLVPVGVVGAAGGSTRYEMSSSGGDVILTTCTAGLAPGAHCEAWVVNASKNKGTDGKSATVSVLLVDVEITDQGFNPIFRGSGVGDATISVDSKLSKASARAQVVVPVDCEEICIEEVVDVAIQWTGTGPLRKHSETSDDDDGTCKMSRTYKSTTRSATVVGTINGVAYGATDLVIPPQIRTSTEEFKSRGCSEPPVFTPQAVTERLATDIFQAG